jgi:hypothetical protein
MDEENILRERARLLRRSQALSVAFSRRLGRGILLVVDDSKALFNPYTRDRILHILKVFVVVDDLTLLDITGKHDRCAIEGRYLRSNAANGSFRFIELTSEAQLAPFVSKDWDYTLNPISETEIDTAFCEFLQAYPEYGAEELAACVHVAR